MSFPCWGFHVDMASTLLVLGSCCFLSVGMQDESSLGEGNLPGYIIRGVKYHVYSVRGWSKPLVVWSLAGR